MRKPARTPTEAAKLLGLSIDDALILQVANIRLVHAAALGQVDLQALAKEHMASSGLGKDGQWVGFEAAAKEWGVTP